MFTKHFLKTLIIFSVMILLGLIGVMVLSYIEKNGIEQPTDVNSNIGVAE